MSSDESPGELKQRMMTAAQELSRKVGVRAACEALEVSPATFYRRRQSSSASKPSSGRASSPRALAPKERQTVHDTLNSERFVDQAPTEVYATLLDAGKYLCSVRTMYRILEEHAELRERRDQLRHPNYEKPVLLATGPNQVWSWDITKLLGPMKWVYFHLYVILDIFSRYVVGWMLAERESAELAKRLIKETCSKQGIVAEQLTLHADRGTSMKSKPLAMLLSDLRPSHVRTTRKILDERVVYGVAGPGCQRSGRSSRMRFCGHPSASLRSTSVRYGRGGTSY